MKKIIYLLFIICLILAACGGEDHKSDKKNTYHIKYTVDTMNCQQYSIVYQTLYGKEFETIKDSPSWSYAFDAQPGDYLYLHIYDLDCSHEFSSYGIQIFINDIEIPSDPVYGPDYEWMTFEYTL